LADRRKRDLLCCASFFVIAAYYRYASFLWIRAPCISSFYTGLPAMRFVSGLIRVLKDAICEVFAQQAV